MAPRPPQLSLSSGPPRYQCVECSHPVSSLFTIYSKDNVRLTQCVSPRILFPLCPLPFPLSRFPQLFSIESASFIRNSSCKLPSHRYLCLFRVGCDCGRYRGYIVLTDDRINARSLRTSILNMTLLSCLLISF